MTHFDVFNGDADGLCALHQLRLVAPMRSVLVTGPERDIAFGADALCRQFATGGGREAAAGIDHPAAGDVDEFLRRFGLAFP